MKEHGDSTAGERVCSAVLSRKLLGTSLGIPSGLLKRLERQGLLTPIACGQQVFYPRQQLIELGLVPPGEVVGEGF